MATTTKDVIAALAAQVASQQQLIEALTAQCDLLVQQVGAHDTSVRVLAKELNALRSAPPTTSPAPLRQQQRQQSATRVIHPNAPKCDACGHQTMHRNARGPVGQRKWVCDDCAK